MLRPVGLAARPSGSRPGRRSWPVVSRWRRSASSRPTYATDSPPAKNAYPACSPKVAPPNPPAATSSPPSTTSASPTPPPAPSWTGSQPPNARSWPCSTSNYPGSSKPTRRPTVRKTGLVVRDRCLEVDGVASGPVLILAGQLHGDRLARASTVSGSLKPRDDMALHQHEDCEDC